MSSLTDTIKEMLADGMKPKEIAEELGCSIQTVYNTKHKENAKKQPGKSETVPEEKPEEKVIEKESFTRKTRFPKEEEEKPKLETYECGACGYVWRAPEDEFQDFCPACGVEFY